MNHTETASQEQLSFDLFRKEVLRDYKVACESRETSLLGRKEVLTGKAKFGTFGDGKEVAQIAMAKFFRPGDFRSGYYRDQTFMFASGLPTVEQFFAQLYADPDVNNEPFSRSRQMYAHSTDEWAGDTEPDLRGQGGRDTLLRVAGDHESQRDGAQQAACQGSPRRKSSGWERRVPM